MPKTNKKAESIKEGTVFHRWTVLRLANKVDYLTCDCQCGEVRDVNVYSLTSGKSKSCGCSVKTIEESNETS